MLVTRKLVALHAVVPEATISYVTPSPRAPVVTVVIGEPKKPFDKE